MDDGDTGVERGFDSGYYSPQPTTATRDQHQQQQQQQQQPSQLQGLSIAELAEAYFAPEKREWRCDKCQRSEAMANQSVLEPLPPYLMLHLKRFHADLKTGTTRKLRTRVVVDPYLSLGRHLERSGSSTSSGSKPEEAAADAAGATAAGGTDAVGDAAGDGEDDAGGAYRLRALVSHHGESSWSGHYTCVVRLGEEDKWASYDDRCVTLLDHDPTLTAAVQRGGYLLLYEKA